MKKAVAILISLALLIGICNFAVYAVNQYSDKIYQYNTILSDSSDSDLINASIYYDILAHSTDELDQIVYERCGYTTTNNYGFDVPVFYLSQEDKKKWREADKVYKDTMNQLRLELGYEAAKPVLDYVGINLVFNGKNYSYHDEQVSSLTEKGMRLYLSKAEILKASEMDYVIKIVCYDPNWTPEDDYTAPSGTMPPVTQNSTVEPTTAENVQIPTDGGPEYSEIMRKMVSEASIYSNIESDKIEIQIKDSSEGMAYAEDYHENGGKKLLEDFKDYGIISIENCYLDFAYYRVFVTLDKKDRKNVIDTCLELFDNPSVIAATPVTTHGEVHFEKGDVNADEALDIIDAVNIQKFTVDRIGFRDEQKSFGDYNNDGICDILDSTAIQKALVAE